MNKRFNSTAQGGFTLIELIVVIVILGILAATALPRFTSLGGDARVATLAAVRGSLASVAAMAHGRSLASTNPAANVVFDGNVSVPLTNGYPSALAVTAQAAGLEDRDFTVIPPSSAATANTPATNATQIAIIPAAIANTPSGLNCFVMYNQSAARNTPPVITVSPTATPDTCQ